MNDFYVFIISGLVIMTIPVLIIAWFQSGFFLSWLNAKRSRGKRILVKLVKPIQDAWTTGYINEGFLVFGKKNAQRRIKLVNDKTGRRGRIYRSWGVYAIDVHDELNACFDYEYKGISGFDAEAFENLLVRALYRPSLEESKEKFILIAIGVLGLLVLISLALLWSVNGQVHALANAGSITGVV